MAKGIRSYLKMVLVMKSDKITDYLCMLHSPTMWIIKQSFEIPCLFLSLLCTQHAQWMFFTDALFLWTKVMVRFGKLSQVAFKLIFTKWSILVKMYVATASQLKSYKVCLAQEHKEKCRGACPCNLKALWKPFSPLIVLNSTINFISFNINHSNS